MAHDPIRDETPCGNRCCLGLTTYIESHFDPAANLRPGDDAAEAVSQFDALCNSDGSGGCGVSIAEMQEYLDGLTGRYSAVKVPA
jgi:hypothetical protein